MRARFEVAIALSIITPWPWASRSAFLLHLDPAERSQERGNPPHLEMTGDPARHGPVAVLDVPRFSVFRGECLADAAGPQRVRRKHAPAASPPPQERPCQGTISYRGRGGRPAERPGGQSAASMLSCSRGRFPVRMAPSGRNIAYMGLKESARSLVRRLRRRLEKRGLPLFRPGIFSAGTRGKLSGRRLSRINLARAFKSSSPTSCSSTSRSPRWTPRAGKSSSPSSDASSERPARPPSSSRTTTGKRPRTWETVWPSSSSGSSCRRDGRKMSSPRRPTTRLTRRPRPRWRSSRASSRNGRGRPPGRLPTADVRILAAGRADAHSESPALRRGPRDVLLARQRFEQRPELVQKDGWSRSRRPTVCTALITLDCGFPLKALLTERRPSRSSAHPSRRDRLGRGPEGLFLAGPLRRPPRRKRGRDGEGMKMIAYEAARKAVPELRRPPSERRGPAGEAFRRGPCGRRRLAPGRSLRSTIPPPWTATPSGPRYSSGNGHCAWPGSPAGTVLSKSSTPAAPAVGYDRGPHPPGNDAVIPREHVRRAPMRSLSAGRSLRGRTSGGQGRISGEGNRPRKKARSSIRPRSVSWPRSDREGPGSARRPWLRSRRAGRSGCLRPTSIQDDLR